ncbi:cytochrome c [uncultured Hyphomicrobium sp.]|uniref:c-type cytochrome n=1 Tax=uncultured Hyphomicrobium sp. TaxID=194373 RepID=UPI0025E5C4F1|nr:cytochrome c [uncultured Hyphomicrobium sp.]
MTGTNALSTLAALFAVTTCCSAALAEPTLDDKGRHALETRCARCHAIGPEGKSPRSDAPPFRDIVKRYPPEDLAESLAEGIMSGHPDMPEFVLAPEEIDGVVAYLRSLLAQ